MTTIQRWQQIKEVFQEARDHPVNQRADYIERVCRADAELRTQVESLLALEDEATGFIEPPAVAIPLPAIPYQRGHGHSQVPKQFDQASAHESACARYQYPATWPVSHGKSQLWIRVNTHALLPLYP